MRYLLRTDRLDKRLESFPPGFTFLRRKCPEREHERRHPWASGYQRTESLDVILHIEPEGADSGRTDQQRDRLGILA